LHLTRLVILVLVLIFSITLLGVSAHWDNVSSQIGLHVEFADMALAISVITILTVMPMVLVDFFRSGAFTSFILVEIVWFTILWVLWLATGALTSSNAVASEIFSSGCDFFDVSDPALATAANDTCRQWGTLQAFEYLNFILLFIYSITLVVFGFIGSNRGEHVWTNSVREFGTGGTAASGQSAAAAPEQGYPMTEAAPDASAHGGTVPMSVSHTQGYSGAAQV